MVSNSTLCSQIARFFLKIRKMDQLALDIFSKVFQYLDNTGLDILNIKLCNSDLKKLVESIHPLHHFISILLSIYSNQSSLPHLQIPSNFVLNEDMVEMIWKRTSTATLFLKKPCHEKNFVRIITTFITQFHTHILSPNYDLVSF